MENQCSQIMLYRKSLKRKLAPMRYEHSLSVSYTCMNLAMRYGCSLDKAELAGLMHDCGKRYSDDIILKKCLKHGLEVTDAEYKALPVLHAKYGAWLAEHKYQITDREILDAISAGYVSYVINTRAILSGIHYEDGAAIRSAASQNHVTMFTSLDTVRVLLDALEEITIGVSAITEEENI